MKTTLRLVIAATAFFALGLQFWLEVHIPRAPGLLASAVNYFSYFTILANAAAALAMLMPLIAPDSGVGRFLARPSVRTAIASYLIVVGITYLTFLRHVGDDHGLERMADQLMHYVTPVLFIIDWIAFVPKGSVPWTTIGTSLVPPFAFGMWTMVHGAVANWYPYPFVDMRSLGYEQGLLNMAGFLIVFIAVALTLVAIDHVMGSVQQPRG